MKLTLYTIDISCSDIITVSIAHVTIFKDNKLDIMFISHDEQLRLITKLIQYYVKFECQGDHIFLSFTEPQRVRFRFDS